MMFPRRLSQDRGIDVVGGRTTQNNTVVLWIGVHLKWNNCNKQLVVKYVTLSHDKSFCWVKAETNNLPILPVQESLVFHGWTVPSRRKRGRLGHFLQESLIVIY